MKTAPPMNTVDFFTFCEVHQLWQAVILKPLKLGECILHFWKSPIFINLVLIGQGHSSVLNTVSALLKPRVSIFQNGFLVGVLLIFDLPGVVIETGLYWLGPIQVAFVFWDRVQFTKNIKQIKSEYLPTQMLVCYVVIVYLLWFILLDFVGYISFLGNCFKLVGVNLRWGSIVSILVFDWGFIDIVMRWGCNQDWGFNRADTVWTSQMKRILMDMMMK